MEDFNPHAEREKALALLEAEDARVAPHACTSGLFKVVMICAANARDERRVREHFAGTVGF